MASSVVTIFNRALQLIGAQRITSPSENTRNARSCNAAWDSVRKAEFRAHTWNCLAKRASLAAGTPAPEWGRSNAFPLPTKFLRLLPLYPEMNSINLDRRIEAGNVVTNESGPLYIRYVEDSEDPNQYDALLCEVLAASLAMAICEEITQSNSKLSNASTLYENTVRKAKRTNAIEGAPATAPDSEWLANRR